MTKWKAKTVTTPSPEVENQRLNSRHSRWLCLYLLPIFLYTSLVLPVSSPAHAASGPKKLKPTDPYALIFGTVWGPDSRPVYGVRVLIRQLPKKRPAWELYSDHSGEFAQRVAAGKADYVVTADLKGLKTADGHPLHLEQPVDVHVEYDERVDIGLHLTQ